MKNEYDIPFNNQLSEALSKLNTSFKSKEKLFNLPALSTYKEGVVDHINILGDESLLSRALRVEDELPFEHSVHGHFNTIRGFWAFITSKDKDYRFRHYTGNKLKYLTRDAEKLVVNDYRSQIVKAVYERLTQYPELFKTIKENTLPIDCYFTKADGKKIRPAYCDWYLKGINLIFNSVKEGKELDLSVLDALHSHKHNVKPIRIAKNSILKDNFTSSIVDFKVWLCNPTSRIRLSCYMKVYNTVEVLLNTFNTEQNSSKATPELINLIKEFLAKNYNKNLRFKITDNNGENFYKRLLNISRQEGDEDIYKLARDAFLLVEYSCRKENGLSNAISKFTVNDGSNDITVSYTNFLTHLLSYMPEEYVNLLSTSYPLDNYSLKYYLLANKTKAIKNIKNMLSDISNELKLTDGATLSDPFDLIEEFEAKADTKVDENFIANNLTTKFNVKDMKPYEVDVLNNRLRNIATIVGIFSNFLRISKDKEKAFIKEIEPTNGEINGFLDEIRNDLNKALEWC